MPPIYCNDGTTLSVQASAFHYCRPRSDVAPWSHVEVMILKAFEPLPRRWWAFHDGWTDAETVGITGAEGGVFAYVPVDLVMAYIDDHNRLLLSPRTLLRRVFYLTRDHFRDILGV